MELVENRVKYYDFIRELRTHEDNASGFLEQVKITKAQQKRYMAEHHDEYFIALMDGEPVGWVGAVDNDIRICTHPDYKGMGIGKFMLNEFMDIQPSAHAKVLWDNEASRNLFMSCGFFPYRKDKQFIYYRRR